MTRRDVDKWTPTRATDAPLSQQDVFTWLGARLTRLDDRSVLEHGQALSLRDPDDIARLLVGLANRACVSTALRRETGTDPMAAAAELGAHCVALMLSLDRAEVARVDTGDAA